MLSVAMFESALPLLARNVDVRARVVRVRCVGEQRRDAEQRAVVGSGEQAERQRGAVRVLRGQRDGNSRFFVRRDVLIVGDRQADAAAGQLDLEERAGRAAGPSVARLRHKSLVWPVSRSRSTTKCCASSRSVARLQLSVTGPA